MYPTAKLKYSQNRPASEKICVFGIPYYYIETCL